MKNKKTLWILTTVTCVLFWSGWISVYASFYLQARNDWAQPIILFFFALAFFGIFVIAVKNKFFAKLTAITALAPSVILAGEKWYLMVLFGIFSFFLFMAAYGRIRREAENRVKINPGFLFKYGIAFLTTAVSLPICAGFYFSIENEPGGSRPELMLKLPDKFVFMTLDVFNSAYPNNDMLNISQGVTVDEYIIESHKNSIIGVEVPDIGQTQPEYVFSPDVVPPEIVDLSRSKLSKQLGIELVGDEEMKKVIADYVNDRIARFFLGSSPESGLMPLGIAAGLFLTLKTIAWTLTYFLVWTTEAIFRIMLWMKMLQIVKVQKEVEEIE